jgi:hypothetical protein
MTTQESSMKLPKSLLTYLVILALVIFVLLTIIWQVKLQYTILVLISGVFLQGINFLIQYISQPKTRRKEAYLKASLFTASIAVAGIGLALLEVFKSQ